MHEFCEDLYRQIIGCMERGGEPTAEVKRGKVCGGMHFGFQMFEPGEIEIHIKLPR